MISFPFLARCFPAATFVTLAMLSGCADPASAGNPPPMAGATAQQQSLRIILKLRDPAIAPTPDVLARLGQACGARLDLIRPMSGGAFVLTLTADNGDAGAALARLARQPDVEFAEADQRARAAKPGAY